ncbi:MFS transporter [Nocardiopsis suaedae]|uniref:MFS transporter n=1 Tax=Nocardiopsis suaedae TaxID=3018444 RepID=A0ABT4TJG3_9ACTN|nr:MFS transporter [Nocardiopsis suaedae]MDA2804833.1 MFS transporter [Nocardiopsis suaedae]
MPETGVDRAAASGGAVPPPSADASPDAAPGRSLRRARGAVVVYFFVAGVILATWASRVPDIKAQVGIDDGALSVGLLGLAVGALAAMQVAGRATDRFGSAAVTLPAAVFGSLALAAPAHAHSLPALFAALFALGAGHGLIDVPMNVHAARVERAYGRPIMASFHAAFSIGGFVGAGTGALSAHIGMSATAAFWTVAAVCTVASFAARPMLLPGRDSEPARSGDEKSGGGGTAPAGRARPRIAPVVLLFGVVAFASFVAEGAATDWTSVYLHDTAGASDAVAAAGFAVFSAAMAAGRLVGDRLAARFGPVALVRSCGLLAAGGLGLALAVPVPPAALAGFALMGAGLSCVVPQAFSAATSYDPARAGRNLGMVAAFGYVGLLSGPVAIGAIAHLTDLRAALAVPALLALVAVAAAGALRPRRPAPAAGPAPQAGSGQV